MRKLLFMALWLTLLPLHVGAAGDTWQNATSLSKGKNTSGTMTDQTSTHWYKFTVQEDGKVDITCTPGSGLSIGYMGLYVVTNNDTHFRGDTWVGDNSKTLTLEDLAPGIYYIKLPRNSGKGSYTVKYEFTPKSGEYANDKEPNNDFTQAKLMPLNGSTTGHLGYYYWNDTDGEDWFKVLVPENGKLDITCTPGAGLSVGYLGIYVYAGDDSHFRRDVWVDTKASTVTEENVAAGTYYIRVRRNNGQGGYTLKNVFTPTSNGHANDKEPNQDFTQANPFSLNSTTTGQLGYYYWNDIDGEDWFKVLVPEDGKLDITCTPGNGLAVGYLGIYVVTNGETHFRRDVWVDTKANTVTEENVAAGTYYIRVRRNNGQGGYTLKNVFTPTSNEYADDKEPNNTFSEAKLLRREHSITGHLGYYFWNDIDDEDWFKIIVPRDGKVVITGTPGNGLTIGYMGIYAVADGKTQFRRDVWVHDKTATVTEENMAPGTYYVRVRRAGGQGGYTLKYNFTQNTYPADKEPNNNRETALTLTKGKTVSGDLGYYYWNDTDKEDWYKIQVTQKSQVNLTCQALGQLYIGYFGLHNNTYLIKDVWLGNATNTITVDNVEPGTYYIKVPHSGGQGNYLLAWDTKIGSVQKQDELPADDDTGNPDIPNGGSSWEDAGTIISGQTVEEEQNDNKTDDWYKVVVKKDGTANFTIQLDAQLDIYYMELCYSNAEGNVQRRYNNYLDAAQNEKKTLTVNDLAPGTYYLHVKRYSGTGKYKLTYKFEPNGYDNDAEPNDNWMQANELARNHSTTGHLGYQYYDNPDKTDWYKINVPRDGKVTLVCTQQDDLDLYYMSLNAIGPDGQPIERNYHDAGGAAEHRIEVADVAADTYYVCIQRYGGPGAYTLSYKFEQNEYASDEEPNQEWTTAQTLVEGQPTSGHLGYFTHKNKYDVDDWFAIDVEQKSTVEITIRLSQTLDIYYLKMHRLNGNNLEDYPNGSIDAYFGEEKKMTLKNVEPGRYYVLVHHYGGYGHYFIGYNCKVDGVTPQDEPPVEPGTGDNNGTGTGNGYFFAYMNDGMYTAFPLSHRPKLTMNGTTFTLTTTRTTVTYEAKDVLKYNMSYINGQALGIGEVISGRITPTVERGPEALYFKGCMPGAKVTIHTIGGQLVEVLTADSEGNATVTLDNLGRGLYIVKSGSATIKINRK